MGGNAVDDVIIRDYRPSDDDQIAKLFFVSFGKALNTVQWRRRFIENPFGKGVITLMFVGDQLVGYYGVHPIDLSANGEELVAAFSMTTMTHPSYGGRGIFTRLADATYAKSAALGWKLVYGFPNKNSHHGFVERLQWKDAGAIVALTNQVRAPDMGPGGIRAVTLDEIGSDFDRLWESVKGDFGIIVPRTSKYLRWRLASNPAATYRVYSFLGNNGIRGYVIVKQYNQDTGHIVDLISNKQPEAVRSLLNAANRDLAERGCKSISCWFPRNHQYYHALMDDGFAEAPTETYFGARLLGPNGKRIDFLDFNRWYITMLDSDVF